LENDNNLQNTTKFDDNIKVKTVPESSKNQKAVFFIQENFPELSLVDI